MSPSRRSSHFPSKMWACGTCTLQQSDKRTTCAACLSVRPDLSTLVAKLKPKAGGSSGKRPRAPAAQQQSQRGCAACMGKHRPHTCGKAIRADRGPDMAAAAPPASATTSLEQPVLAAQPAPMARALSPYRVSASVQTLGRCRSRNRLSHLSTPDRTVSPPLHKRARHSLIGLPARLTRPPPA